MTMTRQERKRQKQAKVLAISISENIDTLRAYFKHSTIFSDTFHVLAVANQLQDSLVCWVAKINKLLKYKPRRRKSK